MGLICTYADLIRNLAMLNMNMNTIGAGDMWQGIRVDFKY